MNTNIIMYEKSPIEFSKFNNSKEIYSNTALNTPTNSPANNNNLINKYTSDHLTKEMCIQSGCIVVCYTARGK
jgi:hypothetical protein